MTIHFADDNDGFDSDEIDAAIRLRSVRLLVEGGGATGWYDDTGFDDQAWAA
ncbi:hypothetical protein ACIA8C_36235 [Nocardia sp. NPDC051321]|uniref:hypothetical protein n=1 Tax=Nocardia sp. NPDC051321 TaxID=3364323 RepID=UPI0037983CD0